MSRRPNKSEGEPTVAPVSAPTQETTPVAQVATIESVKDVAPATKSGLTGGLGYTYFEYDYLEPIEYMPHILVRTIQLSPYCVHGGDGVAAALGFSDLSSVVMYSPSTLKQEFENLQKFWTDAPQFMLDKVLKRDGVRFLPDTFDNPNLLEWRDTLYVAVRMQLTMIRTLIDTASWNEGTWYLRSSFARMNRRCLEAENNLQTIEVSPLYQALGASEPVISPRAGGPVLITLVDMYPIVSKFGTVSSVFINKGAVAPHTLIDSAEDINALLAECEGAIDILRTRDSITGFTWDSSTGRGIRADLKYLNILLTELGFPSSAPISNGNILVDGNIWNQKLYGEAAYGIDSKDGGHKSVAYPLIGSVLAVPRRGFVPFNLWIESGMDEIWAGLPLSNGVPRYLYGYKCQVGLAGSLVAATKYQISLMDRYGGWDASVATEFNLDDGDSARLWMEHCVHSDHQWNEGLLVRHDAAFTVRKVEQPAAYSIHQEASIPLHGYRSAICTAYNIPFRR